MRNYFVIIIFLSTAILLNGCVSEMVSVGHYTYEQIHEMLRQPVKCSARKYTLYLETTDKSDLQERYELAVKSTGCFTLVSRADIAGSIKIKPAVIQTEKTSILEVRTYKSDNILDLHSYKFNRLSLQSRIEDSIADIYATLSKFNEKDRQYAESH